MITSSLKGHKIEHDEGAWMFSDTKEPTVETWEDRLCGNCRLHKTSEGHDACLGTLPGVMNACCGHGDEFDRYIQFPTGKILRGKEAAAWLAKEMNNE